MEAPPPDAFEPAAASSGRDGPGLRCDFCGERVASVRRVALDGDYDRLRKLHRELYACTRCSERKERDRLGLSRS